MNNFQKVIRYIVDAICELLRIFRWDLGLAPREHYALVA